jgi:hypothetical protein
MSQLSAAGVRVFIGSTQVFARSASASSNMSVEGVRILGNSLSQGTVPSGPLETTANIEYYIQGSDPVYALVQTIVGNVGSYKGTDIRIGNATITKAYLTSYSVSAEPEGLVSASCSFVSYERQQNLTIGLVTPPSSFGNLNFAHGQGSSAGIANSVGFSYDASFEWEPILIMGAAGQPQQDGYIFNGGELSMTLRGAGAGNTINYCMTDGTATASAGSVCGGSASQQYTIQGKLAGAEINAEVGGFAEGGFTVTRTL